MTITCLILYKCTFSFWLECRSQQPLPMYKQLVRGPFDLALQVRNPFMKSVSCSYNRFRRANGIILEVSHGILQFLDLRKGQRNTLQVYKHLSVNLSPLLRFMLLSKLHNIDIEHLAKWFSRPDIRLSSGFKRNLKTGIIC